MWEAENQADLVNQDLDASRRGVIKDKIAVPGVDKLHEKPVEQIAKTLAIVLKSRPNLLSFKYVVGSHVEIEFSPEEMDRVL